MATSPAAIAASACAVVDIVRSDAVGQLIQLQQRFQALQRTVILLRGFVNSVALPAFPNLPALATLNTTVYDQIRSSCPGLGLPVLDSALVASLPGISQLDQIRAQYQQAVSGALDKLEQHPLNMINQLQFELDTQIDKVLKAIGPFDQFAKCVCNTLSQINSGAEVEQASVFFNELVNFRPTLIDEQLTGQMNSLNESRINLQTVIS